MTKRKKRFMRLKMMQGDVSFTLVKLVLNDHGYVLVRSHGSHFRFKKLGYPSLTIPAHNGEVNRVYVRDIVKMLSINP